MYTFTAVIQLVSPMHIASPEDGWRCITNKNGLQATSSQNGMPLVRVRREPIYLQEPIEKNGSSETDADNLDAVRPAFIDSTEIPVIPPNLLRGAIRREMAGILFDQFIERGQQASLDAVHLMTTCAHTGAKMGNATAIDYNVHKAGQDNLFTGIWGGGPNMFRSALAVGTGYPICQDTVEADLVPFAYNEYARGNGWKSMYIIPAFRRDDVLAFNDENYGLVIDNYEQVIKEHQKGYIKNTTQRKAAQDAKKEAIKNKESTESIVDVKSDKITNMFAFEAVPAGTSFLIKMRTLRDISDEQLGAIWLAFERLLSKRCQIGGMERYNYGQFQIVEGPMLQKGDEVLSTEQIEEIKDIAIDALSEITPQAIERAFKGEAAA